MSHEVLTKGDNNKINMFYVYLLKSFNYPEQRYIGYTSNLKKRITDHNTGNSFHTSKYKPWILVNYISFSTKDCAIQFEQYLKTASGQAFANRHLWK